MTTSAGCPNSQFSGFGSWKVEAVSGSMNALTLGYPQSTTHFVSYSFPDGIIGCPIRVVYPYFMVNGPDLSVRVNCYSNNAFPSCTVTYQIGWVCMPPPTPPTWHPTKYPTRNPTRKPTNRPTNIPTSYPTFRPTDWPSYAGATSATASALQWSLSQFILACVCGLSVLQLVFPV